MRANKRGRGESDGDGRGGGNGDGQGGGDGDGVIPPFFQGGFVFGWNENSERKGVSCEEKAPPKVNRRPMQVSYKEKLLTLGGAGFLMNHDQEDDIVNGWKKLFAKQNGEKSEERGAERSNEKEDDVHDEDMINGKYPTLKITAEQYSAWCKPWSNSLIIKLLGISVPKNVLIDRVKRMWRPQQAMKIVPLSNDYYIVAFANREDRDYAFQEGPWMINDHYLLVQKWRPNFNPWKADTQRKVAV